MLGQCRHCGGVVSDKATNCPRCKTVDPYRAAPPTAAEPWIEPPRATEPLNPANDEEVHGTSAFPRWLAGLLTLVVALTAATIGRYGVQAFMRETSPTISQMSDEQIVSQFERALTESPDGAYILRMRDSFPADYQRFVRGMVPLARAGGSSAEQRSAAFAYAQTYMREFVRRQQPLMTRAEPHVVSAWVDAQVASYTALGAASPQACAELLQFGSVTPQTGQAVYPTITQEMQRSVNAVFDLIESGHRAPQTYAPLTDEELVALSDAAIVAGADADALNVVGTEAFALHSATARCSVAIGIYRAIAAESNPTLRARLAVAMMSDS